jgi:N-acyl-L-homoserine lactone synthetase
MTKPFSIYIPIKDKSSIKIQASVLKKGADATEVYKQRYRVYSRYGYLHESDFSSKKEADAFDKKECTYVVAKRDERLVGSLRLIEATVLPIEVYFKFKLPKKALDKLERRAEISRLIVERLHPADDLIPRNLIMLSLVQALVEEAMQRDIELGVAYVKQSLLRKLRRLRFPIHVISESKCVYPKNGPMAPYFYSKKDPVSPAYFYIDEVNAYLLSVFHGRFFAKSKEAHMFTLRKDMFNSMLSALGIL